MSSTSYQLPRVKSSLDAESFHIIRSPWSPAGSPCSVPPNKHVLYRSASATPTCRSSPPSHWSRTRCRSVGVQADEKDIERNLVSTIPSFRKEPHISFRETLVTYGSLTRIPGKPVPGGIRSRPLLSSYIEGVENGIASRPGSESSAASASEKTKASTEGQLLEATKTSSNEGQRSARHVSESPEALSRVHSTFEKHSY
jgi:hypothetical protein